MLSTSVLAEDLELNMQCPPLDSPDLGNFTVEMLCNYCGMCLKPETAPADGQIWHGTLPRIFGKGYFRLITN